jgi:hypothetical protein
MSLRLNSLKFKTAERTSTTKQWHMVIIYLKKSQIFCRLKKNIWKKRAQIAQKRESVMEKCSFFYHWLQNNQLKLLRCAFFQVISNQRLLIHCNAIFHIKSLPELHHE